jgi:hypothetical protein
VLCCKSKKNPVKRYRKIQTKIFIQIFRAEAHCIYLINHGLKPVVKKPYLTGL